MKRRFLMVAALAILGFAIVAFASYPAISAQSGNQDKMVGHMVYFTLKDQSEPAKAKLVEACHRYLKDHPGVVFFAAGVLAQDLKREVNVTDYDVALHLVFKTRADHDRYQTAPKHQQFIAENNANWKVVRVFDSYVTAGQ